MWLFIRTWVRDNRGFYTFGEKAAVNRTHSNSSRGFGALEDRGSVWSAFASAKIKASVAARTETFPTLAKWKVVC
jgi:hypothetical protein